MKPLKMQPTFTMNVPLRSAELMPRVRQAIRSPDLSQHVASAGQCIDLRVDPDERRFWSPHLNVQVSDDEVGSEIWRAWVVGSTRVATTRVAKADQHAKASPEDSAEHFVYRQSAPKEDDHRSADSQAPASYSNQERRHQATVLATRNQER